jgi:hypothetical protein
MSLVSGFRDFGNEELLVSSRELLVRAPNWLFLRVRSERFDKVYLLRGTALVRDLRDAVLFDRGVQESIKGLISSVGKRTLGLKD